MAGSAAEGARGERFVTEEASPDAELHTPSPSPAATMHAWGLDSNGAKLSNASRPSTEKQLNDFALLVDRVDIFSCRGRSRATTA